MKTALSILALALPLTSVAAHAQTNNKTGIHVNCTNSDNDSTGTRFCSEFRDAIARSPRYTEVSNGKEDHFNVDIVTVPIVTGGDNRGSAVAMTLNFASKNGGLDYSLDIWSLVAGNDIPGMAKTALASIDGDLAKLSEKP